MKKTFTYKVAGFEFTDITAWGQAWKEAVQMAKEHKVPIFRTIETQGEVREEVFAKGGIFLPEHRVTADKCYIF